MTHHRSRAGAARRVNSLPALAAAAATLLAAEVLRAQGVVDAPAGGAAIVRPPTSPAAPAPAAGGLSPAMTQEVYVAAFRASARQWCAGGGADALAAAAAGTKSIAESSVADAERAGVERAIDGAYLELARAGGCAALVRPTRFVVVEGFEGYAWNARRGDVAPRDGGRRTEDGYLVVTRPVKVGARRFHRVSAEAEFTFTSEREELVRGRYRIAAAPDDFAARWETAERALGERYPTLRLTRARAPDGAAPASAANAADFGAWSTSFVNPDTQALEVRMSATPARAGGAARDAGWVIVVDFLGYVGR